MKIVNKAKFELPEWFGNAVISLCKQADILPDSLTITMKSRNSIRDKRWRFRRLTRRQQGIVQRHLDAPSGLALYNGNDIVIRMTARSRPEDVKYVLAHEIGHIRDIRAGSKLSEKTATQFALACNCYPIGKYQGIKSKRP